MVTQERFKEAEPIFVDALRMMRRLPANHVLIARCLQNLGKLYKNMHREVEAEPLFLEAIDIQRRVLPAGHEDIACRYDCMSRAVYDRATCSKRGQLLKVTNALTSTPSPTFSYTY